MDNLKDIKNEIARAKTIALFPHMNPDGDALGSLLSLGLGLMRLNKKVYMVSGDRIPRIYRHLPGAGRIQKTLTKRVDLAIALDCNRREMLGRGWKIFERARRKLEIDHHLYRNPFGDVHFVDNAASAVGELVYILLRSLKVSMSRDIAKNILTSIIVETNSFRLPTVRPFTFSVCAQLIETGINFSQLTEMVYWSKTKEAVLLSGLCLSRCRFLKKGRIVWSMVKKKDFTKMYGRDEDVDAVADEMRSIKGVSIAIFFREKNKNSLRVSLRSKGKINIARVAESFGGGGHFDVAGCMIPNKNASINAVLKSAECLLS